MTPITEGIININKPQQWTSHDCVAVIRRKLSIKRVGHTGTLDPMATGVLPICIGTSARIMEYLDLDFKTYCCKMKLGIETDTQDIWGTVCNETNTEQITKEQIQDAFIPFSGMIEQIPPKYSAIKVDGRKLYQYARAGEEVEIKARSVYLKDLTIDQIDMEQKEITYTVTCSKGTYIRSICRDIGLALGCGAVMTGLTRTASGMFSLANTIDLEVLRQMELEDIKKLVLPADFPLIHFGRVLLNEERAKYFCNGGHIALSDGEIVRQPVFAEGDLPIPVRDEYRQAYNLYMKNGSTETFLGVAFYNHKYKKLVADKVFYRG